MSNEEKLQAAREALLKASDTLVQAALILGEPPRRHFVVGESGPEEVTRDGVRYPCSPTCTHDDAANPGHPERVKALSGVLAQSSQEPLSVVRAFLGDGEAPCSCAGTVDGDPGCAYCNLKEEARAALEELSEAEYAKGHDAGAEAMREACRAAVQEVLEREGLGNGRVADMFEAAIEGAAP